MKEIVDGGGNDRPAANALSVLRGLGTAENPATSVDVLTQAIGRSALRAIVGAKETSRRNGTVRKL